MSDRSLLSKRDDLYSLRNKGHELKQKLTAINALAIGTTKILNTFTNTFKSLRKGASIIVF